MILLIVVSTNLPTKGLSLESSNSVCIVSVSERSDMFLCAYNCTAYTGNVNCIYLRVSVARIETKIKEMLIGDR